MLWRLRSYLTPELLAILSVWVITAILSAIITTYWDWPVPTITGGVDGAGAEITIQPGEVVAQRLTSELTTPTTLFVPGSATQDLQIDVRTKPTAAGQPLVTNRQLTIALENERHLTGISYHLPALTADQRYLAFSTTSRPVTISANEIDNSDPTAALRLRSPTESEKLATTITYKTITYIPRWQQAAPAGRSQTQRVLWVLRWGAVTTTGVIILFWFARALPPPYRRYTIVVVTVVLVAAGFGIRWWLSRILPVINDEQAFIYDAILFEPRTAIFWKSATLLVLQKIWLSIWGLTTIVTPRLLITFTSLIAIGILARAAQRLVGTATAWGVLAVGLLLPIVAAHSSLVLSEQLMLLPSSLVILMALTFRSDSQIPASRLLLLAAGVGLITLTRWSGVFWLLSVALLLRTSNWREYVRRLSWLTVPYLAAIIVFLVLFPTVVREFDISTEVARFMTLSAARGWGTKLILWGQTLASLSPLWVLAALPLLRRPRYDARILDIIVLFIPPLIAYAIFHKVNAKYSAEILPASLLLAGIGGGQLLARLWQRRALVPAGIVISLFTAWVLYITPNAWERPYAGTLSVEAITAASQYLASHPSPQVVTGAVLIPLLAGQESAFPISHPAWRLSTDPRFTTMFDPVADALERREIGLVFDEKLTTDTYRQHPRIDAALREHYQTVAEFPNTYGRAIEALAPRQP
jgi:hypothetical protein